MTQNPDNVISASRRTDIPAFYMDWFMERIRRGFFRIQNPYTRAVRKLDLSEEKIHTIVFWSKNFDPFIRNQCGEELREMGFNLYFNFTLNSGPSLLEAALPPVDARLEQMKHLAGLFGPETIAWRFDPICFYRESNSGEVQNNLEHFKKIAGKAGNLGITKCVTSFYDHYAKIEKRVRFFSGENELNLSFIDPSTEEKSRILQDMEQQLASKEMALCVCCEKELLDALPLESRIQANACVDGKLFKKVFGGNPETRRDYGQRSKRGCRCTRSVDVGVYDAHPCFHNCLFCYANPEIDTRVTPDSHKGSQSQA